MIKIEHNLMYLNPDRAIMQKDDKYYLYDVANDKIIFSFDELLDINKKENDIKFLIDLICSGESEFICFTDKLVGHMDFDGNMKSDLELCYSKQKYPIEQYS